MAEKSKNQSANISTNRNARREYFVLESYEAGIELVGTEVKSLRNSSVNMRDSWCGFNSHGELLLNQMHISPYEQGNIHNVDPIRPRKLLMHRYELDKINDKVKQQGLTVIPLSLYFKKSKVKVEIGLCKGKKLYDKRETIKQRDDKRNIDRMLKERR